jgi:hypothetical protein
VLFDELVEAAGEAHLVLNSLMVGLKFSVGDHKAVPYTSVTTPPLSCI